MPLSQRCTSQPSAHLSGHCRENLLSPANDGEKLSESFLKAMPHCGVSCRCGGLTPLGKRQSAGKTQQKGACTSPVQLTLALCGSLNTTEILLWEAPLGQCDEKWGESWWGWKPSKKTNLDKESKWMKIKQVVCPQEDSMEEAAGKEGSTFSICTHTWHKADPSKT